MEMRSGVSSAVGRPRLTHSLSGCGPTVKLFSNLTGLYLPHVEVGAKPEAPALPRLPRQRLPMGRRETQGLILEVQAGRGMPGILRMVEQRRTVRRAWFSIWRSAGRSAVVDPPDGGAVLWVGLAFAGGDHATLADQHGVRQPQGDQMVGRRLPGGRLAAAGDDRIDVDASACLGSLGSAGIPINLRSRGGMMLKSSEGRYRPMTSIRGIAGLNNEAAMI